MNRAVKDATTKAFHCDPRDSLRAHVLAFVAAYNLAKQGAPMANALQSHLRRP